MSDEYCGVDTKVGDVVVYANPTSGYLLDQQNAAALLESERQYRVVAVDIRGYETYLWLDGVERPINSVIMAPIAR